MRFGIGISLEFSQGVWMRQYTGGNGSVRKNRNKWQGVVAYREVDAEGNPTSGWKSVTKNFDIKCYPDSNRGKRAAEQALREWRAELDAAEEAAAEAERAAAAYAGAIPTDPTVGEWMTYHVECQKPRENALEASTMDGYRRLAGHVIDRIGDVRLRELKPAQVEWARDDMAATYAASTVHDSLRLLKSALDRAVKGGLIEKNPAEDVSAPVPSRGTPAYLDGPERARLVADLRETLDHPKGGRWEENTRAYALAVELALMTGMREGEVCGLRWQDVDFKDGQIHVRGAIGREGGGYYVKDPKSHKERGIPLVDEDLVSDLKARRKSMVDKCTWAEAKLSPRAFVLGGVDGSYMQPRLLYRAWRRMAERLDLVATDGTRPSFHVLRHTFATVMAHSNVPESSLMSIMGHSSIDVTHRYYVGISSEADKRAMESVSRALRAPASAAD